MPASHCFNIRLPHLKPKTAPCECCLALGNDDPLGGPCRHHQRDGGQPVKTKAERLDFGLGGSTRDQHFQESGNEVHVQSIGRPREFSWMERVCLPMTSHLRGVREKGSLTRHSRRPNQRPRSPIAVKTARPWGPSDDMTSPTETASATAMAMNGTCERSSTSTEPKAGPLSRLVVAPDSGAAVSAWAGIMPMKTMPKTTAERRKRTNRLTRRSRGSPMATGSWAGSTRNCSIRRGGDRRDRLPSNG